MLFQGLHEESWERGKLLGTYTYDHDGDALQTFSVTVSCLGLIEGQLSDSLRFQKDLNLLTSSMASVSLTAQIIMLSEISFHIFI